MKFVISVTSLWLFILATANACNDSNMHKSTPNIDYPNLPKSISDWRETTVGTWHATNSVTGDLNHDGIQDLIVVLEGSTTLWEYKCHSINIRFNPKPIIIAIYHGTEPAGTSGGEARTFDLFLQDNTLLSPRFFGEISSTPLININDKYFSISFQSGNLNLSASQINSSVLLKFREENECTKLIGIDTTKTWGTGGKNLKHTQKVSSNRITGAFTWEDYVGEKLESRSRGKIAIENSFCMGRITGTAHHLETTDIKGQHFIEYGHTSP